MWNIYKKTNSLLFLRDERPRYFPFNMPDKFSMCRMDDARFNYLRGSTDASGDLLTRDLFRSTTNSSSADANPYVTFSYRRSEGGVRWSRSHQRRGS